MSHTGTATASTEHASRYLQQLCKHWSHKCETDFTPENGTVTFPEDRGQLALKASPQALDMTLTVPEGADLAKMQDVVDRHLIRFAFREELTIRWS